MTESVLEVGALPASSYYIQQVATKLADGRYATETVPCVCGSDEPMPVTDKDRYGLPCAMNVCRHCGVVYQSPRMTAEAFSEFYNTEYRLIYDENDSDKDKQYEHACAYGGSLKDLFAYHDITPKSVIDVGCHTGGMLKPFQESGCRVIGVDLDSHSIAYAQAHGIDARYGTMEDLIAGGERADLIMMNHVFEHCLDLPKTLGQVSQLLNKGGYLYLTVPGLKMWPLERLWQNAHTYQFTYDTLEYVMDCCGWEAVYIDENICSLWRYRGTVSPWSRIHPEAAKDNYDWVTQEKRRVPEVKCFNKFPLKDRKVIIERNLQLGIPDISELIDTELGNTAIIVCAGPSVDGQILKIRQLREQGAKIIAIEKMYQWCQRHDLTPDYVVALDASDDVLDSFEMVSSRTTHLLATQCRTEVLQHLKPHKTYLYNTPHAGIDLQPLWEKAGYARCAVINGGGSVSLASMMVAMTLGMSKLHIFGFDCHVTESAYSGGATGVGDQKGYIEVEIGDRVFKTTGSYLSFAQQFEKVVAIGVEVKRLVAVDVYGDSLVNAMYDTSRLKEAVNG